MKSQLHLKLPALFLFAACCAFSQTLGSVTESKEACKAGAGAIANTTCLQVAINCPGLRSLPAQVRVTEPATGVPFRGTVMMGSGGDGGGFYAGPEGGKILITEIAAMGFRVVDKAYEGGTNTFEGGLRKQSCHYATLLTWVHDRFHKQGKFVATGNSGGSADIGYALTTWGRGDILDVAIPTSGPPLSRLDYACVKEASPEWASMCASIVPKGVMECTPGCILGPPRSPADSFVFKSGVCRQVSPDATPQQLLDDSVVHPGAVLNYPKTKLFFLYGAKDCGEPVPIGLTYATNVTSEKTIRFVPNTPHALFSTPEGRAAIKRAIEEGTAVASAQAPPRPGGAASGGGNAQAMAAKKKQYLKDHPPQPSMGLTPLIDLGAGTYKGEQGGLYPGGVNMPPKDHVDAGLKLARQVTPRDQDGKASPDGKIVFLSIGFSNPSIEFPVFIKRAAQEPDLNPRMVMVNGCVGSRASSEQADPNSRYWTELAQRLSTAGVTAQQVQTLWIKEVIPGAEGFPGKAKELAANIEATLRNVHDKFPNARLAYLSSRTYGGWTELGGSPEPGAYETGFAVKWVVSDQLAGKPELNFDPAKGAVVSPWIEWGPYFWTDGVKPRSDGLVYLREDVREDGLHPSDKGSAKVAGMMLKFFRNDPTTRGWFLK